MRKLERSALMLVLLAGLAFADMMGSLMDLSGSIHKHFVLIASLLIILAVFTSQYFKRRILTIRLLMASFILLLLSTTLCSWYVFFLGTFSTIGFGCDCQKKDCQMLCGRIESEKAQAISTGNLLPFDFGSLILIAIGIFGFSLSKTKTLDNALGELLPQGIVTGVILFLVLVLSIFAVSAFLPALRPFDWLIIPLVFAGVLTVISEEKTPGLQKEKYVIASIAAILVGLVLLIYVINLTGSPGFVFKCQGFISWTNSCSWCCSCS